MSESFRDVAVIGLGLLGGSVALAARAHPGVRVVGYDADPAVRARAAEIGLADTMPTLRRRPWPVRNWWCSAYRWGHGCGCRCRGATPARRLRDQRRGIEQGQRAQGAGRSAA
jgi:threonine dehydrogenase-like Zn-dependent dehydrogenase